MLDGILASFYGRVAEFSRPTLAAVIAGARPTGGDGGRETTLYLAAAGRVAADPVIPVSSVPARGVSRAPVQALALAYPRAD